LVPILATEDGIVMDVTPVAFRKALAPMLVCVAIRTLVAPYNNAVAPDNAPGPLNTLVIHDTVIPDFPYNVLPEPGIIARASSRVDSAKMAVVMLELVNAVAEMLVTVAGIVMDVTVDAFTKKLPVGNDNVPDGIITDFIPEPWKALAPILATEDGMIIDVTPDASRKAFAPMLVCVAIRTLVAPYNNAVALDNAPVPLNTLVIHDTVIPDFPYNVLPEPGIIVRLFRRVDSWKIAVVIPELANALEPMLVTEDGMVIEVKVLTDWNADAPMLVTEDGMVIEVKVLTDWNADTPMLVTKEGIVIEVSLVFWKTDIPILVMDDDNVIDVKPVAS
jgi:hypothetical protein